MDFLKRSILLGFLFALIFKVNISFAQGTSNKGKDFWVAYAGVSDDLSSRLTLFITSNNNAVVNINAGGVALTPVNISAGQALPVLINPNTYTNTYNSASDVTNLNAGIHVTSDVDIIVYCHISNSARSASSLILPVKALGNEYYDIAYTQSSSNNRTSVSEFTLVGVEKNTVVEITPKANSLNNTKLANSAFQVTLNTGDVYQYQSNSDLTGSKIKTVGGCKPLAVFSGSTFISFCEAGNNSNANTGDPLYQQLFPTSAWGQNFVTAPFYNAQNGASDIIRIQVAKDNTIIKVNGSSTSALGVTLNNPYSAGSVITYSANVPSIIEGDNPISVTQIQTSQNCNPNNPSNNVRYPGDPEMTILNPIEQTLKDITVYSAISTLSAPTSITKHYLNIILKTLDISTLTVDGASPIGTFKTINSDYSYITVDVTNSSNINPAHRIICDGGFVAIAYGYGSPESYAYLAGADLKNFNTNIEIYKSGSTLETSTLCLGGNYNVELKLPYITNEITWDFNHEQKKTTENNPSYRSEVLNGKTSYYYQYSIVGTDLLTIGDYNLKATVLNPNPTGCDAYEEISSDFRVTAIPKAEFKIDQEKICLGNNVSITDESDGLGEKISKWYWDFGDGSPIEEKTSAASFTHNYSNVGDYQIRLYVESEYGCVSDISDPVLVSIKPLPLADFQTNTFTCLNNDIQFTDKSTVSNQTINQWQWDFGDPTSSSNTSTIQNPIHKYQTVGTYAVKLTVTTDLGCTQTITKNITIHPLPIVDFETPDICLDDASALFTNKSTVADNSSLTYLWNFGDPISGTLNTSTDKNPSHKYSAAKNYDVTLSTTSANGCVTTVIKTFTVNGSTPEAKFKVLNSNSLCSDQPAIFEDYSTVDFGEITKIEWYFDDSTPTIVETDDTPSLRTDSPKQYIHQYPLFHTPEQREVIVIMKAYSGGICVSTLQKTITLKAVPDIKFDDIPAVCQEANSFLITQAAETSNLSGSGSYSGNGITNNGLFSPAIAGEGNHTITYTYLSDKGCQEIKTKTITVNPTPTVNAGLDKMFLLGGSTTLDATATGENISYKWTPSTGLNRDDILNPIASPIVDTKYTLTITSENGCKAVDDVLVKVLKTPVIPNTFTPNNDGVNDLWDIPYLNSYPAFTITIFNRYGKEVYKAVNYFKPWDGKLNNQELPVGAYYYLITVKYGELKYSGTVTLIR